MSKHHATQQDPRATEQEEPTNQRSASQPATAMVRHMLANGNLDPKAIAGVLRAHPAAAGEIFALLHTTVGNQLASAVAAESQLGAPRDVMTADPTGEYLETRVTIDGPPRDEVAPDDSGGYLEARATIDAPVHAESWVTRAQDFNRAHADNVSAFLQARGNAFVDEATREIDPRKVARWQADHGIPPDGRIGKQTVTAAIIVA